jgi:hypothetical protein
VRPGRRPAGQQRHLPAPPPSGDSPRVSESARLTLRRPGTGRQAQAALDTHRLGDSESPAGACGQCAGAAENLNATAPGSDGGSATTLCRAGTAGATPALTQHCRRRGCSHFIATSHWQCY